ncbi:hypothetical protein Tco_0552936 [Tanacetum coccineum]
MLLLFGGRWGVIVRFGGIVMAICGGGGLVAGAIMEKKMSILFSYDMSKPDVCVNSLMATELLKLLFQEARLHILFFCKRCSSEYDDELKVDINRLVTATYSSCALLMKILSEHDMKELSMVLKDYLRSWSKTQIVCDTIPHPKILVEVWVKMQFKDKKEPGARDRTIYNLLSSSYLDISNKALGILTEEELQTYKDLKKSNPKLVCSAMQRILIEILYEEINSTTDSIGKSKNLIESTREFRGCGLELLVDCEKSTSIGI